MAHEVFICYAAEDRTTANAICAKLEEHGIRCWIAPRDTHVGNWTPQIMDAISDAEIVVFVFSAQSNNSRHVHREVMNAFELGKTVVPFRIDDIEPTKDLGYFIRGVHWLDAVTPPIEQHLSKLAADLAAWKQHSGRSNHLPLVAHDVDVTAVIRELRQELDRLRREKTEFEKTSQSSKRRHLAGLTIAAAALIVSMVVALVSLRRDHSLPMAEPRSTATTATSTSSVAASTASTDTTSTDRNADGAAAAENGKTANLLGAAAQLDKRHHVTRTGAETR